MSQYYTLEDKHKSKTAEVENNQAAATIIGDFIKQGIAVYDEHINFSIA